MTKLYTIGYSGGTELAHLKQFVERENLAVVDTRIKPFSRFKPQWNRKALLAELGSQYLSVTDFGNVNYKGGPIQIVNLANGISQVDDLLKRFDGIVLLCTCKDVAVCHRRVVSKALEKHLGVEAVHLHAGDINPDRPPVQLTFL